LAKPVHPEEPVQFVPVRTGEANALPGAAFPGAGVAVTVIRPRRGWQPLGLTQLGRYRDLLWFLALRDIQVRYKQTVLGAAWAVLQPLASMLALLFLGHLTGVAAKCEAPYPIFLFAGLLPWAFFASSVNAASNSLVANSNMLRKIYFPRLIIPLASVGAPLVDYAVASGVLAALMLWYGVGFSAQLLLLPALVLSTITAALGVGVLLSALTAAYRDFRYVVGFLVQIWFFLTPVIYPVALVPERFRGFLSLNPMYGTIEAFRAAVLGQPMPYPAWSVSATVSLICLVAGLAYFARTERRLADVV
jgi:lipopolysaccharide transport system permease protein